MYSYAPKNAVCYMLIATHYPVTRRKRSLKGGIIDRLNVDVLSSNRHLWLSVARYMYTGLNSTIYIHICCFYLSK